MSVTSSTNQVPMLDTRSQVLVLYQKIVTEKDPQKINQMAKRLYELLRRLERENFDPDLAA